MVHAAALLDQFAHAGVAPDDVVAERAAGHMDRPRRGKDAVPGDRAALNRAVVLIRRDGAARLRARHQHIAHRAALDAERRINSALAVEELGMRHRPAEKENRAAALVICNIRSRLAARERAVRDRSARQAGTAAAAVKPRRIAALEPTVRNRASRHVDAAARAQFHKRVSAAQEPAADDPAARHRRAARAALDRQAGQDRGPVAQRERDEARLAEDLRAVHALAVNPDRIEERDRRHVRVDAFGHHDLARHVRRAPKRRKGRLERVRPRLLRRVRIGAAARVVHEDLRRQACERLLLRRRLALEDDRRANHMRTGRKPLERHDLLCRRQGFAVQRPGNRQFLVAHARHDRLDHHIRALRILALVEPEGHLVDLDARIVLVRADARMLRVTRNAREIALDRGKRHARPVGGRRAGDAEVVRDDAEERGVAGLRVRRLRDRHLRHVVRERAAAHRHAAGRRRRRVAVPDDAVLRRAVGLGDAALSRRVARPHAIVDRAVVGVAVLLVDARRTVRARVVINEAVDHRAVLLVNAGDGILAVVVDPRAGQCAGLQVDNAGAI